MQKQITVEIEKIISGGLGLARLIDGKIVMVPKVLPKELVTVRIAGQKKNFIEAELVDVISPSVQRIEPPCPHFGRCGGCDFQHAPYQDQLAFKAAILQEQVRRFTTITAEHLTSIWQEPVAAPQQFQYRQRLQLKVDQQGEIGFFRRRSHELEPVHTCLLARSELNDLLTGIRASDSCRTLLRMSSEIELILSPGDNRVIMDITLPRRPRPAELEQARQFCTEYPDLLGIFFTVPGQCRLAPVTANKHPESEENLLVRFALPLAGCNGEATSLDFSYEPGGFCQVNQVQNENLVAIFLEWANAMGTGRALDLFCGMGNFSLPLAARGWDVVGMDLQGSSIRSAQRNQQAAGLANCAFEKKSAQDGILELAARQEHFDLLVLDPPRAGCADVVPHVATLAPPQVIYISCDPATLCRDLETLRQRGYEVTKMRLVDMFPQTHHMESIVLLESRLL